jgi:hypothetical protein
VVVAGGVVVVGTIDVVGATVVGATVVTGSLVVVVVEVLVDVVLDDVVDEVVVGTACPASSSLSANGDTPISTIASTTSGDQPAHPEDIPPSSSGGVPAGAHPCLLLHQRQQCCHPCNAAGIAIVSSPVAPASVGSSTGVAATAPAHPLPRSTHAGAAPAASSSTTVAAHRRVERRRTHRNTGSPALGSPQAPSMSRAATA